MSIFGYGILTAGHSVGGTPNFDGWPRWDSLTHQQVYEDWLLRAHQGGLQLMVMLAVNNELFCEKANRARGRSCSDSEAIQFQIDGAKRMEADIDSRAGGSGKGWYRIVRGPSEARKVIADGKLAVVLGIEVDNPLDCGVTLKAVCGQDQYGREVCPAPQGSWCSEATVLSRLSALSDQGVRHIFPVHFADNAFAGAAFGVPTQFPIPSERLGSAFVSSVVKQKMQALVDSAPTPIITRTCAGYVSGSCNVLGLTGLGQFLMKAVVSKGMIIDVDHMSALAKRDTFSALSPLGYPVAAGHTGFVDISRGAKSTEANLTAGEVEQIRAGGGIIAVIPHQGKADEIAPFSEPGTTSVRHTCGNSTETFAQAYLYAKSKMKGGAVGFGTDFNGFALEPGPRTGNDACGPGQDRAPGAYVPLPRTTYQFKALANGAQMSRSQVGNKTFDIDEHGLAHVGMLPDFVADLQAIGLTTSDLEPLMGSAEAYVRMWEKVESAKKPEGAQCAQIKARLGITATAIATRIRVIAPTNNSPAPVGPVLKVKDLEALERKCTVAGDATLKTLRATGRQLHTQAVASACLALPTSSGTFAEPVVSASTCANLEKL